MQYFKKYFPSALTVLRMLLAIFLLFLPLLSGWFLLVYLSAGISDILDGTLARRWNVTSQFGAKLDSAADFLLCCVLLYVFLPAYSWQPWALVWIGGIAIVRLAALMTCLIRFHKAAFLHTLTNKATGFLLLCFPFLMRFLGQQVTVILVCTLASISALEELLIQLTANELKPDIRTILQTKNSSK